MSSPRRVGLPESLRMRHDPHFVDQLGRPGGVAIGRLIPIEDIEPNPRQPRQNLGDLSELTASIREKGVLEPILVRQNGARYQIIAGERRYRAALEAGLAEMPCIVRDSTDAETMELALVENLQRKDLTAFEEAEGLKALAEMYDYTHERMAAKLGKSRTSITESLSLTAMPEQVREACRLADIASKSVLLQVVRQADPARMIALVERLQKEGSTRQEARRITREVKPGTGKGRAKPFVYRYQPPEKTFSLALQFRKAQVARDEIVRVLLAIIEDLKREGS
ncbi:MAG TPA: ParB/RepB/Spo0J family partition protein [Vicinamibacteria bacterium]|nr:ParB/RepB/Spo0J family partition protein [Vicinamibacteria bacterium]